MKQIIGQQGDKSNMRKLKNWLRDWEKNRKKPAFKMWVQVYSIYMMLFPHEWSKKTDDREAGVRFVNHELIYS